ncbi:hypothetical protein EYC98_19870 [Halieaceae bacterium IMCC14734]|uniref:DUF4760 domain-containing protein n=1 Tax=Candidatus Litorirhabdus singularis TaxID=2518993 RepID=A0ABT3TLC2_9GAMM|nr:hypothetical protein [Candidatus Litorirhabdus singularis]MCX2983126.1 hypothetical protein [Candidatus Litorirhabdus singularis]
MDWNALGAIAELLGSIAVIVTLLFLLKQLKTNSVMIQNSTAQGAADAIAAWARQLTENPELYRIYRIGLKDDSELSREERGLFDLTLFQAFNSISSIYVQYKNGGCGEDRWESEIRVFAANFHTPGGRASWERQKHMLDINFQREIEAKFGSHNVNS